MTELDVHQTPQQPKWAKQLGLKPNDPRIERLSEITNTFSNLALPIQALPSEKRDAAFQDELRRERGEAVPMASDFVQGIDYKFGRYDGTPGTIDQNALTGIFHEDKPIEHWRLLKSRAFALPSGEILIAHVRGDREVDESAVCRLVGIPEQSLPAANVKPLGSAHGIVNPFISTSDRVKHIFDRDVIGGKEYPGNPEVITSSGDASIYVAFDARKYVQAVTKLSPVMATADISRQLDRPRVIANRPIFVFGGDSANDTASFKSMLTEKLTKKVVGAGIFYGDRSIPDIDTKSDSRLAASINTDVYGEELREYVRILVKDFEKKVSPDAPRPLVTFSSMAMHGIGGPILRQTDIVEYVGPQDGIANLLKELSEKNVEVAQTMLLGLESVYDSERSAFAGEILQNAMPTNPNMRLILQKFIQERKKGEKDQTLFYEALEGILRQSAKGKPDTFKDKNIFVYVAASEIQTFLPELDESMIPQKELEQKDKEPKHKNKVWEKIKQYDVVFIRSNDPATIAAEIEKNPGKTRLIFIQPAQAIADLIARKTMEQPR